MRRNRIICLAMAVAAALSLSAAGEDGFTLVTLNTHSIVEPDYEAKLGAFVDWVATHDYDVIALQEANQTHGGTPVAPEALEGYVPADDDVVINDDNHVMRVASMLAERGIHYYWTWTPIKLGYDIYDEGVGILCKLKPTDVESFYISRSSDYSNWQARKAIGITVSVDGEDVRLYSSHFGWWDDPEEDFQYQFTSFQRFSEGFDGLMFLMGDLNNPAEMEDQGYDMVTSSGWYDTYAMADEKDSGLTVVGEIDGWRDDPTLTEMRIDFIMSNEEIPVRSSSVVFNGDNGPVVSDHFGVEAVVF